MGTWPLKQSNRQSDDLHGVGNTPVLRSMFEQHTQQNKNKRDLTKVFPLLLHIFHYNSWGIGGAHICPISRFVVFLRRLWSRENRNKMRILAGPARRWRMLLELLLGHGLYVVSLISHHTYNIRDIHDIRLSEAFWTANQEPVTEYHLSNTVVSSVATHDWISGELDMVHSHVDLGVNVPRPFCTYATSCTSSTTNSNLECIWKVPSILGNDSQHETLYCYMSHFGVFSLAIHSVYCSIEAALSIRGMITTDTISKYYPCRLN